jgi:hypothetical protein
MRTLPTTRPKPDDYATWFRSYVDRVPDGDVLARLREQVGHMLALLGNTSIEQADHRYEPGKWSVKRVVQHLVDGERMFCYRALCIARGDTQPLPGFDENAYAAHDASDGRTLDAIAAEYRAVRAATLALFEGFDDAAWQRRGVANGQPIAVGALPWIVLGHDLHHFAILRERYGLQLP